MRQSTPDKRDKRVVLMTWLDAKSVAGLDRYAASRGWRFEVLLPDQAKEQVAAEPPDGMIAYVNLPTFAAWAGRQPFPVVNHSALLESSPVPRVCVDDAAAGRMAAEHLLDRGHRHLMYVGYRDPWFSRQRWAGFSARADEAGIEARSHIFDASMMPADRQQSARANRELVSVLGGLPRPAGVFACNDPLGQWVLDAAAEAQRRVPEDLAVVGMDNEPRCLLTRPRLSSIVPPFSEVAYQAAAMLDRLMQGDKLERQEVLIPPSRVVCRQSSDMLAIEDVQIAAAMQFLHKRLVDPIGVDDVAAAAALDRRTLERRFRGIIGRTPLQELQRLRLDAAKELLEDPSLTLDEVAFRSGFESRQWFMTVFRREVGQTPGQFRRVLGGFSVEVQSKDRR